MRSILLLTCLSSIVSSADPSDARYDVFEDVLLSVLGDIHQGKRQIISYIKSLDSADDFSILEDAVEAVESGLSDVRFSLTALGRLDKIAGDVVYYITKFVISRPEVVPDPQVTQLYNMWRKIELRLNALIENV